MSDSKAGAPMTREETLKLLCIGCSVGDEPMEDAEEGWVHRMGAGIVEMFHCDATEPDDEQLVLVERIEKWALSIAAAARKEHHKPGAWPDCPTCLHYFRTDEDQAVENAKLQAALKLAEESALVQAGLVLESEHSRQALAEALRAVEWSDVYDGVNYCPACGNAKPNHREPCQLSAALATHGQDQP